MKSYEPAIFLFIRENCKFENLKLVIFVKVLSTRATIVT